MTDFTDLVADVSCVTVGAAQHAPHIVFAGALPPPVTGMTAMTAVIVDAFKRRTATTVFNWSAGRPLKGWRWRAMRAWGAIKTLVRLPLQGRANGSVLYYPVSSGLGLYYDMAIAALARMLGYRLVLHHHVYSYLDRHDWRAAWLNRLVGSHGAHVVHCILMREHFLAHYSSTARFLFVPPTIVSQKSEATGSTVRHDFTLGLLSNLTMAKGVDDAIAVFDRLLAEGRRVRLILAGPSMGCDEKALIEQASTRWPSQFEYRGPVYGREKAQFYADIDVFLFPTRYHNESWGIVLTEALAAGRPVITRSRGCIPWIVRDGCGLAVDPKDDFVAVAADQVAAWMDAPQEFRAAQAAALQRSDELEDDARRQLPAFVEQVMSLGRS